VSADVTRREAAAAATQDDGGGFRLFEKVFGFKIFMKIHSPIMKKKEALFSKQTYENKS
jgi:hypothetical protein